MSEKDLLVKHTWKQQAEALFFSDHMKISVIADVVRVTRQTVSAHLSCHEKYKSEMDYRKTQSAKARKEYQRQWDRDNRPSNISHKITAESLRREHETAVRILSSEKY
jgi:hypothetical protein